MKTKFGSDQIDVPYYGRYVLKSLTGKVKFCNVSSDKNRSCQNRELVEELTFTYDDTYRGVLLFKAVALDYMPIQLAVYREYTKIPLSNMISTVSVENPSGIDKTYPYFSEVINCLKK